jgi:3-oxoacyl-(acyl-carrier-protein) synthase
VGTGVGGDRSRDLASFRVFAKDRRPHPLTIVRAMSNAAASAVSMAFRLCGPVMSISSACASGTQAIGEAYRMVRFGLAEYAIAGGAESLPAYALYRSWQQMQVLSPDGCRPFAADRNGIVLGEGAGVVVLEPLESARARGARIYAEVAGFGMSADACDWVHPSLDGMCRCMTEAMADAAVEAGDLAYINAHATGTARGDAAEAAAIARVLGDAVGRVPVSSSKALHGHALGASGALEVIATTLALDGGWVPEMPPSRPDAEIPLRLAWHDEHGAPERLDGDVALSNSFALGGVNAAVVLRSVDR